MTKEEAIKVLKNPPRVYDEDMWTALDMAIEVLSDDAVQVVSRATDLISRADAIEAVEFGITYAKAFNKSTGEVKELFNEGNKSLNEAVERLKELPSSDAVKVVRCKDCKRRETDGCMMRDTEWVTVDEGDGYQEDDIVIRDYTVDDGYCSYGERKGGEDE